MATISPPLADNASADCLVNDAILKVVWRQIGKQWRLLGRELLIPDNDLDDMCHKYKDERLREMAYQMVHPRKKAASTKATDSLTAQLQEVGRKDFADEIMTVSPTTEEHSSQKAEWLKRLVNSLHDRYQNCIMKGFPWLDNNIRLADCYINVSVQTGDRNEETTQHNHEAFQSAFSANKGLPGYGKTTLSAKLCFDHTTHEDFMKNFDLVLHFSLRSFEGNLEEMLCSTADLSHDRKMFLKILNLSTRILLVFDEVPKQHVKPILTLLQEHRYRHIAVVVTARPGQFTFRMCERENDGCPKLCEVTVDWNLIWHSRITILGIDDSVKKEFIVKHLENLPGEIKSKALPWS